MPGIYSQDEHFKPPLSRLCYGSLLGKRMNAFAQWFAVQRKGKALLVLTICENDIKKRVHNIINWKMELKYTPN